jgi:hypothetical protein
LVDWEITLQLVVDQTIQVALAVFLEAEEAEEAEDA